MTGRKLVLHKVTNKLKSLTIIPGLMVRFFTIFTLVLQFIYVSSSAQQVIKGTVYDKNTRSPLSGASVTIYTAERSVIKGQAVTDHDGQFTIANPPAGNYNLIISYLGYQAHRIPITVSNAAKTYKLDMKQTGLVPNSIKLNTVNVRGNKPLITVRKDTIEFSAGDFYTAENASLKNLLQKIPGLTVGKDGAFYFQGKKINDLYIDGRPAFSTGANSSGDPKELSMLLQSNLVDKIQFADKRGLDGTTPPGSSDKVINITIKKEMKKGVNGKLGGGYGTEGRYTASGNLNAFREKKMTIVSGGANNTGLIAPVGAYEELAYAPIQAGNYDIQSMSGSTSFDAASGGKISLNARLGQNATDVQTVTDRTNILPDSIFQYQSNSSNSSKGKIGGIGAIIEQKLNSLASLNLSFTGGIGRFDKETNTGFSTTGKTTANKINTGNTRNSSVADKTNYMLSAFFNQSFKKPGRMLLFNVGLLHNGNVEDQQNVTLNELFLSNARDTINQKIHLKTSNHTLNLGPAFREPISKTLTLDLRYSLGNSLTRNEQYASDYDINTMSYSKENKNLSYIFRNNQVTHSFTTGFLYSRDKLSANLSVAYAMNKSSSRNYVDDQHVEQNINYWSPGLALTYRIDNFKTFNLNFNRAVDLPRMESLIPIVSTTNPLYIQLGNPDLKPIIKNMINVEYTSVGLQGVSFNFRSNTSFDRNGISTNVYSDSIGRQISKPVNVNGNWESKMTIGIGKRFDKLSLTINYGLEPMISRNTNFINSAKNMTSTYGASQGIFLNWNFRKVLESNFMIDWSYNGSRYSIQDNYFDYLTYGCNLSVAAFLPLQINIGSAYMFSHNTAQQQSNSLLNIWIAKTWLADKSIQTKFYCFDLLRQYKSFSTQQTATYIEQTSNNNITQYFLGSVTWFFGKKKTAQ